MAGISGIREHMEVIGADGVHVGTIDKVEGNRLKLIKADSGQGSHKGHRHYVSAGLVAEVENDKVRLSATGANALLFQEEQDHGTSQLVTSGKNTGFARRQDVRDRFNSVDWNKIGIGAAAVAAATATGAAFFSRSKKPRPDTYELQLQNDENVRLISSSKVEGTLVVGRSGEHLGKIENFMVDKYSGRVAYAVLSFGGTLGFGESLFPLPWSYLRYDVAKDGYVLNLTKEQLANVPKFSASDAPEFSPEYRRNLAQAYGRFDD